MELISKHELLNAWWINDQGKPCSVLELINEDMTIEQIYKATNTNLQKNVLLYSRPAKLISLNPNANYNLLGVRT